MNVKNAIISILSKWLLLLTLVAFATALWNLRFLGASITTLTKGNMMDFLKAFIIPEVIKTSPFTFFLSASLTIPLWQRNKRGITVLIIATSIAAAIVVVMSKHFYNTTKTNEFKAEKKFKFSAIYPYPSFEKDKIHKVVNEIFFLEFANSKQGYLTLNLKKGKIQLKKPAVFSNDTIIFEGKRAQTSFNFLKEGSQLSKILYIVEMHTPEKSTSLSGIIGVILLSLATVFCLAKTIHSFDPVKFGIAGTFAVFSISTLIFNLSFYLTNLSLSISEGTRFEKLGIIWGYFVASTIIAITGQIINTIRRKIK